jgi:hypothetical protein
MAVEREWTYEGTVSGGEADGRACVFCKQQIVDESRPGRWILKAVEDNPDTDFVVEDGYAHYTCTQERLAKGRKSRFSLPDVPEGPTRR